MNLQIESDTQVTLNKDLIMMGAVRLNGPTCSLDRSAVCALECHFSVLLESAANCLPACARLKIHRALRFVRERERERGRSAVRKRRHRLKEAAFDVGALGESVDGCIVSPCLPIVHGLESSGW